MRMELKLSAARTSAVTIRVSATPLTATGGGVDYPDFRNSRAILSNFVAIPHTNICFCCDFIL